MDIFSRDLYKDLLYFNLTSFVQQTKLPPPIAGTFISVGYDASNGSFCKGRTHTTSTFRTRTVTASAARTVSEIQTRI